MWESPAQAQVAAWARGAHTQGSAMGLVLVLGRKGRGLSPRSCWTESRFGWAELEAAAVEFFRPWAERGALGRNGHSHSILQVFVFSIFQKLFECSFDNSALVFLLFCVQFLSKIISFREQ